MHCLTNGKNYIAIVTLAFIIQSCAGSGTLGISGNSRTYQLDFNSMVNTVQQAVRGVNLAIVNSNESEDPQRIVLTYARLESSGGEIIQRHQGTIHIERLEEKQTEVSIENPNYHFATSDRDRENYRRILFNRIDDILDQ